MARQVAFEINNPDSHDLAWAAGFFDGEGCFSTMKPHYRRTDGSLLGRRYLRLSVDQKEPQLLARFIQIFGEGAVYEYNRTDAMRRMYKFQASGKGAFRIASRLWPYIGERKKADFKRALSIIRQSRGGG